MHSTSQEILPSSLTHLIAYQTVKSWIVFFHGVLLYLVHGGVVLAV